MRWHEITVHTTEEAVEMISNFMHEQGSGGVSIEESGSLNRKRDTPYGEWFDLPLNDIPEGRVIMKSYYAVGTDMEAIHTNLERFMENLESFEIDTGHPEISLKDVDDEEWADAWKQYFKPVRITERLTVKPSWEEYEASPGELILELDPGMAFGTGTHATTSLCLQTLERVVKPGDDVIDVGTGSGILSVAAAMLGARHVLALDLDPVAVSSAKENAELNGLSEQITVQLSDLLGVLQNKSEDQALGVHLPVQVVVANILAEIIMLFTDDVYQALQPGGKYITSGIIKMKENAVAEALEKSGFIVRDRYYDQDWVALVAEKE
ncbi:50S ribosomal protein L11 methyltransferase [Gorillibacterium massiliense]|uniref:50S ribosomal protein L11 methyltransferase n=1 Tax=Gorillibacterium massiliense TaxID=1280390 RepID=UPI000592C7A1|nr:50S ribosomal protein L11 methyltransferase [Gorillibacterium massiliense]